jgi:hypothetical protein
MGFDVPILFLVFNRPDLTAEVFSVLRQLRPKRLFVAADGPRPNVDGEVALCREARTIATAVDWECELKTLFRDKNHGCGPAVSGAISWFFDQVEEGVILEDDCLPSLSFFNFCKYALEKYREDTRIGTVSGDYFLPPDLFLDQPYYFSKYFQIWGWATWRRVWKKYRLDLSFETEENWLSIFSEVHSAPLEADYWIEILRALTKGTLNTWDYQMMFVSWREQLLHVAPTRNLVSNIGYRPDATHTSFESPLANFPRREIKDFEVDLEVCPLSHLDNLTFYVRFLESLRSTWWLRLALNKDGFKDGVPDFGPHFQELAAQVHRLEHSHQRIERALQHLVESNQRIDNAQQSLYLFNKLFSPIFALQRWLGKRNR